MNSVIPPLDVNISFTFYRVQPQVQTLQVVVILLSKKSVLQYLQRRPDECAEPVIGRTICTVAQWADLLVKLFAPGWPPAVGLSLSTDTQHIRPLMSCEPPQNKAIQSIRSGGCMAGCSSRFQVWGPISLPGLLILSTYIKQWSKTQCSQVTVLPRLCSRPSWIQSAVTVSNAELHIFSSPPVWNCCWSRRWCINIQGKM